MESEARLVMIDGGVPPDALQYEIVDHYGRVWRVDFAWPDQKVAVEYDGFDWHSDQKSFPETARSVRRSKKWVGLSYR